MENLHRMMVDGGVVDISEEFLFWFQVGLLLFEVGSISVLVPFLVWAMHNTFQQRDEDFDNRMMSQNNDE